MIDEFINDIILECIPSGKYSHEWKGELLKQKILNIFVLDLPIELWIEEEGVDEEEVRKRIRDQVIQKYKDKKNMYSSDLMSFAEKRVMLFQIDKDWQDHLAAMDMLRGSVNLRALGGKDPFFEYKRESFGYFDEMLSNQNEKVLKTLFNLELVTKNKENSSIKKIDPSTNIVSKKIGRNSPCPCGSGKKYKFCHGS